MVDAATGEVVENIMGVEISLSPFEVVAAIVVKNVEIDLDNIEVREAGESDTSRDDGGRGTPDDQPYSH